MKNNVYFYFKYFVMHIQKRKDIIYIYINHMGACLMQFTYEQFIYDKSEYM